MGMNVLHEILPEYASHLLTTQYILVSTQTKLFLVKAGSVSPRFRNEVQIENMVTGSEQFGVF
jgi:hypothetical protein